MSRISEHSVMLVVFLTIILAITASGFYEQRRNSIPLPTDGVHLARWPYDSAVLPEGTASSPPPPMPPPTAYFSPSQESTFENVEITFDASISYDPFGQIASYEWDFGDGSRGSGEVVTHSYSSAGNYEVMLTVTGVLGATSNISRPIAIDQGIKGDVSNDGEVSSRSMDREFRSWAMSSEHNALLQNFPNPFNPETWIPYQLKEDREVTIRIYCVAGNLVRQLDMGHKPAGLYMDRDRAAYWDGRSSAGETVASGVYFYSIHAGDFYATRKLTVLR